MKVSTILFLMISTLLCGGKSRETHQNNSNAIKELNIDPEKSDINRLSEVFSDYTIIKIKTNPDNLISEVAKIIACNNLYYVLDQGPKPAVFCIDNSGDILFKIQNFGEGPGEFKSIKSFDVDQESKTILIYSPGQYKLLHFNLENGDFIKEDKTDKIFASDFLTNGELIYWYNDGLAGLNYNNLFITNREFHILHEYLPFKGARDAISKSNNFFKFNDTISFVYGLTDTIYAIFRNHIFPRFSVNFGENSITEREKEGDLRTIFKTIKNCKNGHAGFISNFCESDKHVVFNYSFNFKPQMAIYKKGQSLINISENKNDLYGVDFPAPIVANFPSPVTFDDEGNLITVYYPMHFIDKASISKESHLQAEEILQGIEISDNPIIVKLEFSDTF